jgi:hypothetical protein
MATVHELFEEAKRSLLPEEFRQLGGMILRESTEGRLPLGEYSGEWTDEDLHDLSNATLQYVDSMCPEQSDAERG